LWAASCSVLNSMHPNHHAIALRARFQLSLVTRETVCEVAHPTTICQPHSSPDLQPAATGPLPIEVDLFQYARIFFGSAPSTNEHYFMRPSTDLAKRRFYRSPAPCDKECPASYFRITSFTSRGVDSTPLTGWNRRPGCQYQRHERGRSSRPAPSPLG
jgi:hypothetical protein